jgi:hypothetical protein
LGEEARSSNSAGVAGQMKLIHVEEHLEGINGEAQVRGMQLLCRDALVKGTHDDSSLCCLRCC